MIDPSQTTVAAPETPAVPADPVRVEGPDEDEAGEILEDWEPEVDYLFLPYLSDALGNPIW